MGRGDNGCPGNDAPTPIRTHAMPSGEVSLDYGSILIEDLCETMSEGPYESAMLADGESHVQGGGDSYRARGTFFDYPRR